MLRGAGPVGYCPKVLKGVLLTERFVPGSSFLICTCWLLGVLLLVPAFCSYPLFLALGFLVLLAPRHCGFVTLRVPRRCSSMTATITRRVDFQWSTRFTSLEPFLWSRPRLTKHGFTRLASCTLIYPISRSPCPVTCKPIQASVGREAAHCSRNENTKDEDSKDEDSKDEDSKDEDSKTSETRSKN